MIRLLFWSLGVLLVIAWCALKWADLTDPDFADQHGVLLSPQQMALGPEDALVGFMGDAGYVDCWIRLCPFETDCVGFEGECPRLRFKRLERPWNSPPP